MSHQKTAPVLVKSVDAEQGIVTSLRAVFGNVDAQNDRIILGAFTRNVKSWAARMQQGQFLPVVYGHRDDPDYIIGKVLAMRETDEGLETQEKYFLTKPKARATFDAIKEGVLPGGSFTYDIRRAKRASDGVQELHELDLIEVGPTLYPANDATRLVGVKGAEVSDGAGQKAGRVLSAKNEAAIRQIHALASDLLALLETEAEGKTEEPEEAKVEDHPLRKATQEEMEALFAATG